MTSPEYAALRVAAAQDVLTRIIPDAAVEITTGCYVRVDYTTRRPCRACAAGALTLAVIAPGVAGKMMAATGLTLAEEIDTFFQKGEDLEGDDVREPLLAIFDVDQLALIEAAFMRGFVGVFADRYFKCNDGQGRYASTISVHHDAEEVLEGKDLDLYRQLRQAVEFGVPYGYEHERLAAIMENIVRNGGTFVPEE